VGALGSGVASVGHGTANGQELFRDNSWQWDIVMGMDGIERNMLYTCSLAGLYSLHNCVPFTISKNQIIYFV
jgi:hypothetical protein